MDLSGENAQREKFRQILFEMSQRQYTPLNKSEISEINKRLEALYCWENERKERYRHFYSDIFNVFIKFEDGELPGSAEIFCCNLEMIRREYKPTKNKDGKIVDISESLKKLYDHASLEMARINYSTKRDRSELQQKKIDEISGKTNVYKSKLDNLNLAVGQLKESTKNMQKEYVAILGIFAAALMTFFSGVGFSSSVLANIHQASIYRIAMGIILLGMILFDIIWFLLEFIKMMLSKGKKDWKPFCVVNGASVTLFVLVYAAWANMRMYWWHFPWIDP